MNDAYANEQQQQRLCVLSSRLWNLGSGYDYSPVVLCTLEILNMSCYVGVATYGDTLWTEGRVRQQSNGDRFCETKEPMAGLLVTACLDVMLALVLCLMFVRPLYHVSYNLRVLDLEQKMIWERLQSKWDPTFYASSASSLALSRTTTTTTTLPSHVYVNGTMASAHADDTPVGTGAVHAIYATIHASHVDNKTPTDATNTPVLSMTTATTATYRRNTDTNARGSVHDNEQGEGERERGGGGMDIIELPPIPSAHPLPPSNNRLVDAIIAATLTPKDTSRVSTLYSHPEPDTDTNMDVDEPGRNNASSPMLEILATTNESQPHILFFNGKEKEEGKLHK
ncbi:hypothetical protein RFI_17187 [Reticulomyxa filosa]|uniref:Uncharacterized protein n=1 Tax=Reticulomyxa filosa TaxID=46433 RepID=X6N1U0_RETFI|nr:hypothetical protein RFI_17187 [Reticulomyxa filosa]|eukprot:ETO20031.1 hypothetical protein RFI_17187 [Reticulomyxa filosa]